MNVTAGKDFLGGYARRHGCAWFELGDQGASSPDQAKGWYSVGGLPALRFQSWRELPEGVIWWTNLSRAEAWSLGRWSVFKEGALFGPDWPALMTESGHGASDEAVAGAVRAWSETFSRCAEWLSNWASLHDAQNPWDWGEGTLADALAPRFGWVPDAAEEPQPILQAAYVETIDQEMPAHLLAGRRRVTLAFPRVDHSRRLWGTRYPKGEWKEVNAWPRSGEDRLAWVRSQEKPLLVRIRILGWRPGQEAMGALWLGLRGRRFPAAEMGPLWLTGEEAVLLGTFAQLDIDEGFVGNGWTKLPPPEGWSMSSDDPLVTLSWSQALLADAAWRSAASPTRDPQKRRRSWFTSRSVWWRAADRMRCFQAASALHQKGWAILGYGQGQVTLLVDTDQQASPLADAIMQAGLLMPSLIARLAPVTALADHTDMVQVDRWLKQTGGSALPLIDVDRLVAPWPGSAAEVRGVIEPAAQRLFKLSPVPNTAWQSWWSTSLNQQARRSVDRLKARFQR